MDLEEFEAEVYRTRALCRIRTSTGECGTAPLALLLGWFASKREHVAKYAAIYERMGYSTIVIIAPASVTFGIGHANQKAEAEAILRLLCVHPKVRAAVDEQAGVVIHAFSNGGAYVLRWMYGLLGLPSFGNPEDKPWIEKIRSGDVFAGVVYDSCPCAMEPYCAVRAILGGKPDANPIAKILVTVCFYIYMFLFYLVEGNPMRVFLEDCEKVDFGPEVYFYSDADYVMEAPQTEAIIKRKMQARNTPDAELIREFHFTDSNHVAHLRKHPDVYNQAIVDFHNKWVRSFREKRNSPSWPSY